MVTMPSKELGRSVTDVQSSSSGARKKEKKKKSMKILKKKIASKIYSTFIS